MVGAGGAFISVPFMTACNVRIHNAVATSAALGFPIAAAGTAGFIIAGLRQGGLPPYTLGYVYLKKGLNDPALQQFKYALEIAQRASNDAIPERPEYHYHMGLALQALGRGNEAATSFERALSNPPPVAVTT